jgi:hypothetical protein
MRRKFIFLGNQKYKIKSVFAILDFGRFVTILFPKTIPIRLFSELSVFLTFRMELKMKSNKKMFFRLSIFFFTVLKCSIINGQVVHPSNNIAFLQDEVASVYININPTLLDYILDVDSLESNTAYPAQFIYQSSIVTDTVENIGFRLRGNTSRYADKKSFKISFNSFVQGQKWFELEKLNLNGEHNDPSILRSYTAAYCLNSADLISPRNSYVKLFVNNEYKGLYYNTEHIDEEFLKKRFINDDNGNLYKASYGADLTYLGNNPSNYFNFYELKTNKNSNDYSGLINFLNVLNNSNDQDFPCAIQQVFDVESYLKTLAIEILCGHWDGHAYNKNNFYLYQRPSDNKFMLIEYDMDNTLGIDWMGINWATRNLFDWSHSSQLRPLYNRIMEVPYFRDLFTYHIDIFLNSFFNNSTLFPILEAKQNLIEAAALLDTYKGMDYGFTNNDFQNALIQAWGSHVTTSIASFIYNRNLSAGNQTNYLALSNPCPLEIDDSIDISEEEIEGYFDITGKRIQEPSRNQVTIVKYTSGKTQKIITFE